jgi:hypothetical protein
VPTTTPPATPCAAPTAAATAAAAPPATIDEVLARLDVIIDRARRARDRAGFFAALYRAVTARVQEGIAAGRFEDGPRMERFDVLFARRYLDAEAAWRAGRPTSACWRVAFESSRRWPPLVLQHLLLGMNAHITFDLALSAADVAPGAQLPALERDFLEINHLLVELVDEMQERLAAVSPWLSILDRIGDRTDEALCGLALRRVRAHAWEAAGRLAACDGARRDEEIARLDALATALTIPILTPGPLARLVRVGVRLGESGDVPRIIDVLAGPRAPRRTA